MSDPSPWGPTPPPVWTPPTLPRRRGPGFAAAAWIAVALIVAGFLGVGVGRRAHSVLAAGAGRRGAPPPAVAGVSDQVQAIAAAVDPALVDINTQLGYQGAQAAGTGMILRSTGEILTNNHVIAGATTITVVVIGSGQTYTATVVGTDRTADLAVLRIQGASGLPVIRAGDASKVAPGDPVVAIGNAGGVGGSPSVVTGQVQAVGQAITASNDDGSGSEQLSNLIETTAPIQPGDSGGPLLNAAGQVIGMDTAAATGSRVFAHGTTGYAIPIDQALAVVAQIESGRASATVEIGTPGFLGVQIQRGAATPGAPVGKVVGASPAERAGIVAGDVITAVNGQPVMSPDDLTAALHGHHSGDRVTVQWVDPAGATHTVPVPLADGPAD